ncbi:MAG: ATP-binding protein [Mucilaginibacter sp.]|nr:ATP-binding protein [Mucilaginibacter sp.]
MDFSTSYFGKPLNALLYDDIANYFVEPKQETETIEFKSFANSEQFDKSLQIVIRGISAFLNSSGGILIWGAPKGIKVPGQSEKVFVGELAPVTEYKEKDSLINKITSVITPMPIGVRVEVLQSESSYTYIFEVQPSIYKPHQFDTRYYVRLDGQTKPAPHYLIDALIKQISYPDIKGVINFDNITLASNGDFHLPIKIGIFNFSELQNEELVSIRLVISGGYFKRARDPNVTDKSRYNSSGQLVLNNFIPVLHFGIPHIYNDILVIDDIEQRFSAGKLRLILTFGGKHSPAKYSSYILNFENYHEDKVLNSLIELCEENIFFSEGKANSINDVLNSFTGRNA